MKLTVGLGSIDQYIRFVKAGADEFFLRVCAVFLVRKIWNGSSTKPARSSKLPGAAWCF